MSARYGYDDKDMYRRDYSRGSWDRGDRGEVWSDQDRMHDQWQDRRPGRGGGEWDRRPYHEPAVPHWDRRGPPDMDRGPRDDWPPREPRGSWSRPHDPPLPLPPRDRDIYREPPPPRDRADRPPIPHGPSHGPSMDWEAPPRSSGVVRKREAPPEPYDDRAPYDRSDSRDRPGRSGADDPDWKRRKVDLDEFETSGPPSAGPDDRGRNDDEYGSRRRLEPSEPSQHIIFLGLDPDFVEEDLKAYLTTKGAALDSVTIIRDRVTGLSRGFGFAQFTAVSGATSFLMPNFPFVQLPPPASKPAAVGRRAKIDFSQSAHQGSDGASGGGGPRNRPGHDTMGKAAIRNDGTRDIGSAPTPLLLIRSLDKGTTIDEIAEALRTAEGPNGGGAQAMKRILLIRDRGSSQSWGFAFIEMLDVDTAKSLLAGIMNPTYHPTGFKIDGRVIAASFALPYAFQVLPPTSPQEPHTLVPSKAVGGVEEGEGWTRYWDETASVEEKTYDATLPKPKPVADDKMAIDSPEKPAPEEPKAAAAAPAPTALPTTTIPFSMKFKTAKAAEKEKADAAKVTVAPEKAVKAAVAPGNALGFVDDAPEAESNKADQAQPATSQVTEGKSSTAKVAPMAASSKVAKNITKWNQVKEELNEPEPAQAAPAETPVATVVSKDPTTPSDLKPGDAGFEYGDPIALTCLLCLRQLKSFTNLRNPQLCKTATEKVAAARRTILSGQSTIRQKKKADQASADNKYRDRAQERRQVHNQPDVPILPAANAGKPRFAEGPAAEASTPTPAPPVDPGKDETNVGNKMLKKMGWSEGSGLGAEGEGRAEPVTAAVYSSGAGIGASKGKEVTGFTSTNYADAAKESARERFESS
ncbi:hypothetical protein FRC04_004090 [Tulasnella sp. 424]|nr:hypothetical protein FRC04_004090 [Tulasnella sp. 424]